MPRQAPDRFAATLVEAATGAQWAPWRVIPDPDPAPFVDTTAAIAASTSIDPDAAIAAVTSVVAAVEGLLLLHRWQPFLISDTEGSGCLRRDFVFFRQILRAREHSMRMGI